HRHKRVVLQERIRFAAVLPNQHFDRLHNEVRLGCQFWNTLYRFASWETKPVHELVILFVVESKTPVRIGHSFKLTRWILKLISGFFQLLIEQSETAKGKLLQNRFLILKVIVDHGNTVLNGIGDFADRERLPSFGTHDPPGRVQDGRPDLLLLPLPAFSDSHWDFIRDVNGVRNAKVRKNSIKIKFRQEISLYPPDN